MTCDACSTGYSLSSDATICVAHINGCEVYDTSVCTTCAIGYFLNSEGKCVVEGVQYCLTYDVLSSTAGFNNMTGVDVAGPVCTACIVGYTLTMPNNSTNLTEK